MFVIKALSSVFIFSYDGLPTFALDRRTVCSLLYQPACFSNDHLCARQVELLPQLPLMKNHLDAVDALEERKFKHTGHLVHLQDLHVNTLQTNLQICVQHMSN